MEADYQHIEDRAAAHAEEEAAQVDGATARVEARAVVLRHKGHGGLHKGRDDEVAVDLEGDGGGRSGDGGSAEAVDGTLDEDVGEGEDHALQAGGKAYLHNLAQLRAPHLHGTQVEADVAFLVGQNPYYTAGRHKVGADGGDGHAVHAHIAHQHKEEVEDDVHHAADAQPVEGPFGVAGRPQDGVAEVVDHHRGEAQSVDAQVLGGVVEDVGGGVERLKDGACHRHSQHQQGKAADEGDEGRRGHGAPDVAAVALAYARGDDDVGAHRDADEEVHQQRDDGAVGTDGGKGVRTHELTHHRHVDGIERLLHDTAGDERQGKHYYLPGETAASRHVYCIGHCAMNLWISIVPAGTILII